MKNNQIPLENFEHILQDIIDQKEVKDFDILLKIRKILKERFEFLSSQKQLNRAINWNDFRTFWPPRLLAALRKDKLASFFGAGLSIPSDLPSWNSLLLNYLKIDDKFTSDKDLESDPLTLAEIGSNQLGAENLQEILRSQYSKQEKPVTNHYFSAALRLPVYITTNYDCLFESAWKVINKNIKLTVITNDIDVSIIDLENLPKNQSYLFKIHGCVTKHDEQLILTRKDYRLHYRSNKMFFDKIRKILLDFHVLFLGFSHKDIEVTRLVDDAIYEYEKNISSEKPLSQPNFYSLQFDMRSHTPEIFAAKGIVALEPPVTDLGGDYRSEALNTALAELLLADFFDLGETVSLESQLDHIKKVLDSAVEKGIGTLKLDEEKAKNSMETSDFSWLTPLLDKLSFLANEGVYLCNADGKVLDYALPSKYLKSDRPAKDLSFFNRPYFRQSKTFRKPFVSDSFKSIYNADSTFALCLPLFKEEDFIGVLFSACQLGHWNLPISEAEELWQNDLSVILLDSNGNCLFPPNNEFGVSKNGGFNFEKLLLLSKKDRIISRLIENVIPINKDDDVISISKSIKYYCLITDVQETRWKIGLAKAIILNS